MYNYVYSISGGIEQPITRYHQYFVYSYVYTTNSCLPCPSEGGFCITCTDFVYGSVYGLLAGNLSLDLRLFSCTGVLCTVCTFSYIKDTIKTTP